MENGYSQGHQVSTEVGTKGHLLEGEHSLRSHFLWVGPRYSDIHVAVAQDWRPRRAKDPASALWRRFEVVEA